MTPPPRRGKALRSPQQGSPAPVGDGPGFVRIGRFALLRTAAALGTLLGVLTLVFFVMAASPGDPASLALREGRGRATAPAAIASFRRLYGLDRPLLARYLSFVVNTARLDFGRSFMDGRPVREKILETLPATLALNGGAILLALLLAVPAGVVAARAPGGLFDRWSGVVCDGLFALPSFALGMALLLVFSVKLRITPLFADSDAGLIGYVLPVTTLALATVPALARFVRAAVLESLRTPASTAATARGESSWETTRRALRRSAVSFAAMGAALLPSCVSGSVLVERLFSVPGSGGLLADAVFARDMPTVLGLSCLTAVVVVVGSVTADVVSGLLDPRVAEGAG